ncbi:hypothetical protein [Actinocorallia populi]|uniref:hypothetical protein n=1 Tax=Actinocorallia populi TaxID=2079200 RepID=UPI000D08FD15|nr:hypothetical protein [Actinocorallia populi]
MAGRSRKQKKPDSRKRAEAAQKAQTAQRARTARRARAPRLPAGRPAKRTPWLPLLLRGLLVVAAGYLASLISFVSFFSGGTLFAADPARPFSGAALIAGGVLLLPPLLYYGAARLTAAATPLTRTWQGRLRWSIVAYVLTMLLAVLLDFSQISFLLAALPAAFILGERTFRAALLACALLTCTVIALW